MFRVSKFALWFTLGVSFSAKKALGFLFASKRAFKVCLRIFNSTSYQNIDTIGEKLNTGDGSLNDKNSIYVKNLWQNTLRVK